MDSVLKFLPFYVLNKVDNSKFLFRTGQGNRFNLLFLKISENASFFLETNLIKRLFYFV